jgi:leader peptidase (prepilin peptidase) / N-methyltransferase
VLVIGYWFVVGSFVGSFLNVVVYRLPRNCLSINKPRRSFCPSCKTQLKWNDNIPIVGWLVLRGKCRYCGFKFGIRYPLVELMTAGLFAFAAWRALYGDVALVGDATMPAVASWQAWVTLLHLLLMIGVLLPWALIDADLTYIPDKLTLGPLIVFIPFAAWYPAIDYGLPASISPRMFGLETLWLDSLLSNVLTGVLGYIGLWTMGKIANRVFAERVKEMGGEAMGGADIKLMILLGVMLGWPKMLAGFFVAIAVGALFGIVQLAMKKGHGMPFGPYLAIGALLAALATPWLFSVVTWYFSLLEGAV